MHRLISYKIATSKTLLCLILLCAGSPLFAQLSGPLNGTLEAGTYQVISDISVEVGDSLIIEPGTTLQFDSVFNFNIYGYLEAVGTPTDSLHFVPTTSGEPWGSIIFRTGSSPNSQLSYSVITGAGGSAINCYWVDITISHCTIVNNTANWGGGIYVSYCNPNISHCYVGGNQSVNNGGGIYCTRSSPTISYCTVIDNSCNIGGAGSGRGGGGICVNHASSPTIEHGVIQDNYSAESGGGISINDDCHPQISYCDISNNSADTSGGGIYCNQISNPVIFDCDITGNEAPRGGGICLLGNSTITVDSCRINGNTVTTHGGGIHCSASDPQFNRCAVTGNHAPQNGGGIFCAQSNPTFSHVTVAHNQSDSAGGGYYFNGGIPIILNSILWNDIATYGQEICLSDTANLSISYSDLHHSQDSVHIQLGSTLDWGEGMIDSDPAFVDPENHDVHLWSHSPCIDAGDPASPLDPDNTVADMGAYYYHQAAVPSPVHDLVADNDSIDVNLSWSPVTEDLLGNPIAINHYCIYRNPDPEFLPSAQSLIDSTIDTTYTDPGIISLPEHKQYYIITAIPNTE